MRTQLLLRSAIERVRRHGKTVAATVAFVVIAVAVLPAQGSAAPSLAARLASATRVAKQVNGSGYWLVSSQGAVSAFGGARLYGSMTGRNLTAPIVGIVATADGRGYWLVASDGGVFAFGDAKFAGSLGGKFAAGSIVGMASSSGAASGTAGARGPQGLIGPRGRVGANGATGVAGIQGLAGPQGLAGTNGVAGTNGTNGATGGTGATGTNGTNGATGGTGVAGTNGATGGTGATGGSGPTGGTGAQGAAGIPNYAYIYNTGAQTVAIEGAILFGINGPQLGFAHSAGLAGTVVPVTGTYRVNFSVSGVEPNQFALMVNGSAAASRTYGSGAGTQQNTGQVIVTLDVGDIITVANHSSASAITLQTLAGGTATSVNASLLIEQLG